MDTNVVFPRFMQDDPHSRTTQESSVIDSNTVFPRFKHEDHEGWLIQAEQFFNCYLVPTNQRVTFAIIHFTGESLEWYRCLHQSRGVTSWLQFSTQLYGRFGSRMHVAPHCIAIFDQLPPPSVTKQLPPPHQVASATPTPSNSLPPCWSSQSPTLVVTTVAESPLKHTSVVTTIMDGGSLPSFGTCSYVSVDIQGYQFTTVTALVFDFIPEVPVHSDCRTWTPVCIFQERKRPEDASAIRIWLVPWEEEQLQPKGTIDIRIWLVP